MTIYYIQAKVNRRCSFFFFIFLIRSAYSFTWQMSVKYTGVEGEMNTQIEKCFSPLHDGKSVVLLLKKKAKTKQKQKNVKIKARWSRNFAKPCFSWHVRNFTSTPTNVPINHHAKFQRIRFQKVDDVICEQTNFYRIFFLFNRKMSLQS